MPTTSSHRHRHRSANRAQETPPTSSASSSSDSSFSDDEEARIGSTPRAGGKQWTMHSVSKGAGGRTSGYNSTRQDDYSDDGYGSSEDEKPKKPSSKKGGYPASSSDASYDSDPNQNPSKRGKSSANTGKGDDQEDEDGTDGNSKKWWWIGGFAAIIVVILIIGGLYLWNRPDSAASDGSASASGAANATSLAPSSAATGSSASTMDQITTSTLDSTTSADVTESVTTSTAPSKTKNAETPKSSPTPSKTQPDPAPSTTYAAQITWFDAPKEASECGTKASNDDYVVRISPELYGDPESVSPLCGTWISLYQLEKDSGVRATIEGISQNMTGHNLDLSRKVFQALTSNLKLGTTLAQWWLTEEKYRPIASLSSSAGELRHATPTGKGDPKGDGGKEKEGTVTIATAPNPPLETGGSSLHEEELSPNGISVMSDS